MAITLALVPLSVAEDSPQDYVAARNVAHSQVCVGPIAGDETVASYASDYANTLASDRAQLVHSGGPYGENLAWTSPDLTSTGSGEHLGCGRA
ncbi:hypothetical protein NL676_039030 [Syzygium grande]|nr:hypothetical protein NL676_039030 [Syzygium grande]